MKAKRFRLPFSFSCVFCFCCAQCVLREISGRECFLRRAFGVEKRECRREESAEDEEKKISSFTYFLFFPRLRLASQLKIKIQCPPTPAGASWASRPRRATLVYAADSLQPRLQAAVAARDAEGASRDSQLGSSLQRLETSGARPATTRTRTTSTPPTRGAREQQEAAAISSSPRGARECTAARCSTPEGASLSGRTGRVAR